MGLFDMFKKSSSEDKKDSFEFLMPVSGEVIKIEDIPDEVFSKKMMGDGFGILPKSNKIYSPVNGEVVSIFPTKHAIGLKTNEGIEILLHIGIDTVNLKGEGFEAFVQAGDQVKAGDLLLDVDFDSIKDKVPSIISPIIFTDLKNHTFDVKYGNFEEKTNDFITIERGE